MCKIEKHIHILITIVNNIAGKPPRPRGCGQYTVVDCKAILYSKLFTSSDRGKEHAAKYILPSTL